MVSNTGNESISLNDWVAYHHTEEEMHSIFLNMDRALKYIHEKGYCVEVFYPTEIEVLNNDDDYVLFNKLMKLPADPVESRQYIQEDIFNSSLIQIGMYSDSIQYITPSFLKEHFDEFIPFIPAEDVPYYRGVVQRDATVYFCEFSLEKRNRDLQTLAKEFGEEEEFNLKKNQNVDLTNRSINDVIYQKISHFSERAYVNLLLIPILILGMVLSLGVLFWFIQYFVS